MEQKQLILNEVYSISSSYEVIKSQNNESKLSELIRSVYEEETYNEIIEFISEEISIEEIDSNNASQSLKVYMESLEKIKKIMDAKKGYEAMGEINLKISEEDFHLEDEVNVVNEMDSTHSA